MLPTPFAGPKVLCDWTGEFFWLGDSLMWRHPEPETWTWVHRLDATEEILGTTTNFKVDGDVDEDTLLAVRVLGWRGRVVRASAQHPDLGRVSVIAVVDKAEDDHPLAKDGVVAKFLVL